MTKTRKEQANSLRIEQLGVLYLMGKQDYMYGDRKYLEYRDQEISAEIDRLNDSLPLSLKHSLAR